jgi:succinoglycan biosynthesis protein ExoM
MDTRVCASNPLSGASAALVQDGSSRHIAVCVCTYKRPHLLKRLLQELSVQGTENLFTYSVVIVDNDESQSGKATVSEFAAGSIMRVSYHVESRQSIALARNKAVENAEGDFVAFIDDDEVPTKHWLVTLFRTWEKYRVDGVLGPVKPHFDEGAPKWIVEGGFYDRATYPTGFVIDGAKGRTGNVLLNKKVFASIPHPFKAEFRTGEDQDFFRRMIERKHVFIWCDEAVVYESVPRMRWNRAFMLQRALLRGQNAVIHPTFGLRDIIKSVIAVPAYAAALPFALVLGHHRFMTILIKLFDHLGKVCALLGIQPISDQYITE